MASEIIGSSIDSKVLQRQNFNKEPNGLETIIEAYAIKTANRDFELCSRFGLLKIEPGVLEKTTRSNLKLRKHSRREE